MDLERAIDAQRLKLLRLIAGWLAVVAFVSGAPFSPEFPRWVRAYVSSVLSRAECAAQYLVIAQARLIAGRTGCDFDQALFFDCAALNSAGQARGESLAALRGRLKTLRVVLENLPRYGLRLLHRVEKRARRLVHERIAVPCSDMQDAKTLCAWRLIGVRIERPPDKGISARLGRFYLPPNSGGRRRRLEPQSLFDDFSHGREKRADFLNGVVVTH